MKNNPQAFTKPKKTANVLIASTLGVALLLGGSTYALWSATDTSSTGSTITTGDLKVTAASTHKWFDVTSATPSEITDLASYRLNPGATIKLVQNLNAVVYGNNISGILNVKIPNSTASAAIMAQAKFSLAIFDKNGKQLGKVSPTSNSANSLSLEVADLQKTDASGEAYSVEVTVELPSEADNATSVQAVSLDNMQITLTQGAALVAPTISTVSLPDVTVGNSYSEFVAASGNNVIYSLKSGDSLPAGLSLNSSTGEISGTASTVGSSTFTVIATNAGGSVSIQLTINVEPLTVVFVDNGYGNPDGSARGMNVYSSSPASIAWAEQSIQGGDLFQTDPYSASTTVDTYFSPVSSIEYMSGNTVASTVVATNKTMVIRVERDVNGNIVSLVDVWIQKDQPGVAPVGQWEKWTLANGAVVTVGK